MLHCGEVGVAQNGKVGRNRGVHAFHLHLVEGTNRAGDCSRAIFAPHDEFADEVVVVLAHGVTRFVSAVKSHTKAVGHFECGDGAGRRQELATRRIFGIDANLDAVSVASGVDLLLRHRQLFAVSNENLPLHQVNARDYFAHGVFYLQPSVHF